MRKGKALDNDYLGGLDYFKIIAALLVVAIHTSPLASFNSDADFILTRIIARIAVPFFLMTTGYFCVHEPSRAIRAIQKTLLLYAVATVLYLPVNFYAGHLQGLTIAGVFRMLFFDGTFYHLWYLPASVMGISLILVLMRMNLPHRQLSFGMLTVIALLLYVIGLFGDSYFGFLPEESIVGGFYENMFRIFSYTRNGIFLAPVFLLLGMGIKLRRQRCTDITPSVLGFLIFFIAMIDEGLVLRSLGVQRHDSMYLFLPPCMFFLFQMVSHLKLRPVKALRTISAWIYILHPLCIILVRGGAKLLHLEGVFIDNSLVHYIAVCLLSGICSIIIYITMQKLPSLKNKGNRCFPKARAWIELDRDNLHKNITALSTLLPEGCTLMPAVKANAYGHGATLIAKELNRLGIRAFCVATVSEGAELRRHGVRGEILVLGYTHPGQFPLLWRYRLTQTVVDSPYAELLNSYGRKIRVHIKIDTGMHRLGERCEKTDEISGIFQYKKLNVTGIFTHLCVADTGSAEDKAFTLKQGEAFHKVISMLKERGCSCGKIHLLASYGLINYPQLGGDYTRIGIALYGMLSTREHLKNCPIALYPVLSLKARIALVKNLYAGESAGYGLQYTAEQDRKIAVLTIGYADGIPRRLSTARAQGHNYVLLHGRPAPIIGRICMDCMLIDVTAIPDAKSGDIATIIGRDGRKEITACQLAQAAGTITNELLSRLGGRLERIWS